MTKIYDIKLCEAKEVDKLQAFIDTQWKSRHVLALSKPLLDFQHLEKNFSQYNFIIALNTISAEIDGLIGFIPTSHYDPDLINQRDVWGAIWKVREDIENEEIKTLGLYLFEAFREITAFKTFSAIGISAIAKKIYKALRFKLGILNQYYILNEIVKDFKIAKIVDRPIRAKFTQKTESTLQEISIFQIDRNFPSTYAPHKSVNYLINRYAEHPIYKYSFIGVYTGKQLNTILVLRTLLAEGSKIIRIVDLLGDYKNLPNLYTDFQALLSQVDAEYIDCVNYGISESVFLQMGFTRLNTGDSNIVPNYFEPFEQKNINIEFAYKSESDYIIFKGDSDQDRPNVIT